MENPASVCPGRCVVCLAPAVGKVFCTNQKREPLFEVEVCGEHGAYKE